MYLDVVQVQDDTLSSDIRMKMNTDLESYYNPTMLMRWQDDTMRLEVDNKTCC